MHPAALKFMCTFLCSILFISNLPIFFDSSDNNIMELQLDDNDFTPQHTSRGNEPVTFTNVTKTAGLSGVNGNFFSWTDYNNDGYFDLLVNGWRLFENDGPPYYNFTDVTSAANLSGGVSNGVWGDYDNDGWLDLYACAGQNQKDKLWHNNGNGTFTDVTAAAGNVTDLYPTSAAGWGDYDNDGDIDLYIANGEDWNSGNPVYFADVLYQNNGDGTFTDVTVSAGINDYTNPFYGRGVAWGDYDNDGWLDVYISNYRIQPNYLWRNNHDGTFTNVAFTTNTTGSPTMYQGSGPYYGHTIGSSWGDLNNDGYLDIWVSNLVHKYVGGSDIRGYICDDSNIFENRGAPFFNFTDIRPNTGIPYKPVGDQSVYIGDEFWFNAALADIDNDGDLDVYIPQGGGEYYNVSYAYSFLYRNNGDGTYTDITTSTGVRTWCTYGGAWADFNEDGFPDLITSGKVPQNGGKYEVKLYRNNGNSNNWLHVKLNGTESNRHGIGARVTLRSSSGEQIRELEGGMGAHSSQNSLPVEFGLGSDTSITYVQVLWPSGIRQRESASINQHITITEDTTGYRITSISVDKTTAFEDEILTFNGAATGNPGHYEWDFDGDGEYDFAGGAAGPVTHAYTKAGEFNARLTAWDELGSVDAFASTDYITVTNVDPTADAGTDMTVWEDEVFTFNASKSTDTASDIPLLNYRWDFDDGTPVSDWYDSPLINYSFGISGNYDVTLSVRDDDGALSADTVTVTVKNKPPEADAGADRVVAEDEEILLQGIWNDTISDIPYVTCKWDFGDGETTSWMKEWNASHIYKEMGVYTSIFSVRDGDDITTDSTNVTVYNPVPAAFVIANFSAVEDQEVALQGWGTDNPSDKNALDYYWDFGDGANSGWLSGSANTTHKYSQAGAYNATLLVRDGDLAEANATVVVTVSNLAPKATAGKDKKGGEDEELGFTGTGEDTPSDMPLLEYRWDFGDGSERENWSASPDAVHAYTDEGSYEAKLFVRDNNGAVDGDTLLVTVLNADPVADISVDKTKADEDEVVTFSAEKSTDTASDLPLLNYTWDFGDGTIVHGLAVTHKFLTSGSFNVVLKVEDDNDDSDTDSAAIEIANVRPSAKINITGTLYAGETLTFNAGGTTDTANDLDSLSFSWDFGDGNRSTGKIVMYTYAKAGKYMVRLTVIDDDGESGVQNQLLIIDGPEEKDDSAVTGEQEASLVIPVVIIIVVVVIIVILLFLMLRKKPVQEKRKRGIEGDMEMEPAGIYDAEVMEADEAGIPVDGTAAAGMIPAAEVKAPFCGQCGAQGQFMEQTNSFVCPVCNIVLAEAGTHQLPPAGIEEERENGTDGQSEPEEQAGEEDGELPDEPEVAEAADVVQTDEADEVDKGKAEEERGE